MAAASEDTVLQFVAPPLTASATTPVRTARIHPGVIDSVRYSFTRRPPLAERVIGTLLGSILPDGTGDIRNCYAVPHVESSNDVRVDLAFHRNMLASHLRMNPEEIVIGWYSTGVGVNVVSSWIHASYAAEVTNPIHLTVDVGFTNVEGTIKAYIGSFGLLANRRLAAQFQEIPVDLSLLEAERETAIDDTIGQQLLNWQKFERADKNWIDKFGKLLPTSLELSDGIERRSVCFGMLFEMDDQLYDGDEKPIILPSCVTRNLLSHEKFFMSWASLQEERVAKGGILADEMGLDKMIQAVCFVLVRREADRELDRGVVGNTLVVSPNIDGWIAQIANCSLPGSTKFLVYGLDIEISSDEIMKYDFVITSYSTLKDDYRRHMMGVNSLLQSVHWNRIILDEANLIRSGSRNIAKACFGLKATYRWALVNDPFKNNFKELHSMVAFLKTPPYSFYFCQECNCKTIDPIEKNAVCLCGHDASVHFKWWKKYVIKPIAKYGDSEKGQRAMSLLRYKYLRHLLLRRRVSYGP